MIYPGRRGALNFAAFPGRLIDISQNIQMNTLRKGLDKAILVSLAGLIIILPIQVKAFSV
jgi:hypothetical protein